MKKPIFKKLNILFLFSVNANPHREMLDGCTLHLHGLKPRAFKNNLISIKSQLKNTDHFSENVTFINSIKGQPVLKSVKETEVIPLT